MKKHINYYFLALTAFLSVAGMLFLSTLSATESLKLFGNTNYYLFHQLTAIIIGLVFFLIALKTPLHWIKKASPFIFGIVLLACILAPFMGVNLWGAKRWINIFGITFQPSEFLKIAAILYVSSLISNKLSTGHKKGSFGSAKNNFYRLYLPFIFILGVISVVLIKQTDMTTLGIITISLLAIYFFSGTPIWHTILSVGIMISGAVYFIIKEPFRIRRLLVFMNPEIDPQGIGFQLRQSLIALGSGGIFGNGLGMSTQKFGFLPAAMTDSLFAIMGEELGIIGCTILVGLFLGFLWLSFNIAKSADDTFSKLVVIGIGAWIVTQAFVNIMSSIGVFPLSGVPLPFFSYGGSHIIAELVAAGIILNISKNG